jgi:outer membrane autotransporter protein
MTHELLPVFSRRLGLFTALALLAVIAPAFAQSVWTGDTNNEFSDGTNWDPGLPGANDAATVDDGSPQVTNSATIGQLGVNGGNVTITNTGTLTVINGTTLTSGSIGINADGILNSDVSLDGGNLFIDGTLNGKLTLNAGGVAVNGTLGSATVGATTSLSNNGTVGDVTVETDGTFTNNTTGVAGALTNAGTASNSGTIASLTNTGGEFTNNSDGKITGKTIVSAGKVTNNFEMTDADVAAAAIFVNNNGATAGHARNSGTTTNNGTIASLQNDAGTFTNNFGGVVSGATNISGGTVTNNATMQDVNVGANGTFTNATDGVAGAVTNAGNNTSNSGEIASLTNTAGEFVNNSGGTILGLTTVSGGRVINNFEITDADVAAAAEFVNNSDGIAGNIRNSGTVTSAGEIASLQNDAGSFTNNGGGVVSGTTTINGGTVTNNAQLANVDIGSAGTFTNNSAGTAGAVTNAGTASNDGTIASLLNNAGSFSNTGTISGAAIVTGGELVNEGTVIGTIDVFDGGLLSGSGVSGGLTIGNGGTLSPGPGIQTLAVNGNLTFGSGSTYQVDITSTGLSDLVNTSGQLTIAGGSTLDIRAASSTYGLSTSYTILTAGSIVGEFDTVTSDFAFLTATPIYNSTTVDLTLDRNNVRFADVALTKNDRTTASIIEDLGATNTLFQSVLSLNSPTAESAFSQLNGEVHASLKTALLWGSQFPRDAIIDQTNSLVETRSTYSDGASFWASGIFAQSNFSNDGTARDLDTRLTGSIFGADMPVSDQWRLGGILGYSYLSAQPQATAGSYYAGLYTAGDFGPLNVLGGAIYTRNDISTQRDISFGVFSDQLLADYASDTAQVFGDISWTMELDDIKLQPFANLAYIHLDTDDFREDGGAAALTVTNNSNNLTVSTIGMRWAANLPTDMPVVASGMIGWRHAAGDITPMSLFAFDGSSPFILEGVTMPRDSLVVKAGISAKLSKSARLTLTYAGEFASDFKSNAAQANLLVNF